MYSDVIAISNRKLSKHPYLEQVERICKLHPKAFILREKDLSEAEYEALAKEVLGVCEKYEVECILHTYWEVAKRLGQKKIHLPYASFVELSKRGDTPLVEWQVGTSIHKVEEAMEAQRLGAVYVTAGHIYATDCKKGLAPRGIPFLQEICDAVAIPVYAIGGIHLEGKTRKEVAAAGAGGACIMSELMQI